MSRPTQKTRKVVVSKSAARAHVSRADSSAADTIGARAPTFTIVSDLATGRVLRMETVLTDGTLCVFRPLTPEEIEDFERELTAPRH